MRLSKFYSKEHGIFDLQALISAFFNDPELAHISNESTVCIKWM